MVRSFLLFVTAILVMSCGIQSGVTSGDDPSSAVSLRWSLHESQRPDGNRLRFFGGTMHSIPSNLRLVNRSGQVVASAPAMFSPSGGGLCGDTQAVGTASAELPLPATDVLAFRGGWAAGYRVEAEVGGVWRFTALTHAGCNTAD